MDRHRPDGSESAAANASALARPPLPTLDQTAFMAGAVVGDYRLLREIGAGSMGRVFEALDLVRHRAVALKTIRSVGAESLYRFKREFRLAANLNHPNVAALYELVVDLPELAEAAAFFTMELVEGVPFTTFSANARDPIETTRRLAPGLISAVEALHRTDVVHLDLKPDNVLVDRTERPVVLDFGLARRIEAKPGAFDRAGLTPAYAPPERFAGEPPSAASDWYAVGVMLYESLTGAPLFRGSIAEVVARKLSDDIPPPSRLRAAVPPDLDRLCQALVHREPARRLEAVAARRAQPVSDVRSPGISEVSAGVDDILAAAAQAWQAGNSVRLWVQAGGHAESGAVLERLTSSLGALVLRGKCHPLEIVPHNVFDGAADELASHLLGRSEAELRALLPPELATAALAFPVLRDLASKLGLETPARVDRDAAFRAFKAVLLAVTRRVRLCLVVEDVHRGDLDSARLFLELFAVAPVPPILLVLVSQSSPAGRGEFLAELERAGAPACLRGLDYEVTLADSRPAGPPRTWHVGLDLQMRSLVELLALAGHSLPQRCVLEVLTHVSEADLARARVLMLVDFLRLRPNAPVSLHPRLADVEIEIPAERRRELHRAIAQALSGATDMEATLARHWRAAGENEIAARHARAAADAAADALAFNRAAELYGIAREWQGWSEAEAQVLERRRGEMLVAAGRLADAAAVQAALGQRLGDAGLLRSAGEHYLAAGFHEQGLALLRPLLLSAGVKTPISILGNLLSVATNLARAALLSSRSGRQSSTSALAAVDLCWSVTRGLLATDFVRGAHFAAEGLIRAIGLADNVRRARALATVGGTLLGPFGGVVGRWGERMLARARELAVRENHQSLLGMIEVLAGQLDLVRGRFAAAYDRSLTGHRLLLASEHGTFERNVGRMGALRAAEELGRYEYIRLRAYRYLHEARQAGDRYGALTFAFSAALAALAADRPGAAEAMIKQAAQGWPARGFHIQHLYIARALAITALYRGDLGAARAIVDELWPALERSQLLRVPVARIDALALRTRVTLAAEDAASLARAASDTNRLLADRRADARGWGALAAAALAERAGNRGLASAHLARAAEAFASMGMRGMHICADFRRAELDGDLAAKARAADDLEGLGIARPVRWVAAHVAGAARNAR